MSTSDKSSIGLESSADVGAGHRGPLQRAGRIDRQQIPLSYAQQRLWFLDRLEGSSTEYNVPMALRLTGHLDRVALERTINAIIERHESLRTHFEERDGEPVQVIEPELRIDVAVEDLSRLDPQAQGDHVRAALRQEWMRAFDLSRGPLVRMKLLKLADREHVLLRTLHHIASDGWSEGVFNNEFMTLYDAFRTGKEQPLKPLPVQYADFALWQRSWLDKEAASGGVAYWREQLAGIPDRLDLPADRPRPPRQTVDADVCQVALSAEQTASLKRFSRRHDVTLYMTLLASFGMLLSRYSGQDDIVLGSPVANRRDPQLKDLIGCFANSLVMRLRVAPETTFTALLKQVRRTALEAYQHQDIPFAWLVEELKPQRSLNAAPLYQVLFALQNARWVPPTLEGLEVEPIRGERCRVTCDLEVHALDRDDRLGFFWVYNRDLFDRWRMEQMARHYVQVLEEVLADAQRDITRIPLLQPDESHRILHEWNATATDCPTHACVHELFEAQARQTPDAVAIVFKDAAVSYGELNRRANKIAHYLRGVGVRPDARVGICLQRGVDLLVALLGVLKAGGAYVPLDPTYPAERLQFMVEDSAAVVLLTQGDVRRPQADPGNGIAVVDVTAADAAWRAQPTGDLDAATVGLTPAHLAYVIYTSGSTGRPKGVMVPHATVVNFFAGMDRTVLPTQPACWLAVTSASFDISVLELVWTMSRGVRVVVQEDAHLLHDPVVPSLPAPTRPMDFSLFYFADSQLDAGGVYELLIEGAKFADRHGFTAIWTPERHFDRFGGPFPNPSVLAGALAMVTTRLQIRAGSVVLPLHDPIRVAEEWAVVDQLSQGRVGVSFASGWHDRDFVLAPDAYRNRKVLTTEYVEQVRALWRGERLRRRSGSGHEVEVGIFPRPVQPELPVWMTVAGNPDAFRIAGEMGANVLTHLLGQSLDELQDKIERYRTAIRNSPHGGPGHVTLMLHTFVAPTREEVEQTIRAPLCEYLKSSVDLMKRVATGLGDQIEALRDTDLAAIIDSAFERYYATSGLFGTPQTCLATIRKLQAMGVDEVACLIDFGIDTKTVLANLEHLETVRRLSRASEEPAVSVPERITRHGVTHLQCTPSLARVLINQPGGHAALASLQTLLVGGEALPRDLADTLLQDGPTAIWNMYGPTETTIWSLTTRVTGDRAETTIGTPIANTRVYILDEHLEPVPIGVGGELYIGGSGVARGYLNRPGLAAERFRPDPFAAESGARMYKTGDIGRWRPDGTVEFLGRNDFQIKIRGYRIELGEIEAALARHPAIREAVVVASADPRGDQRLVAYYTSRDARDPGVGAEVLRAHVAATLPEAMIPAAYVRLDSLPLTANGKLDRKALPAPDEDAYAVRDYEEPVGEIETGMARLWAELLKIDRVGRRDHFFELGGHSLLAIRLVERMRRSGWHVDVRTLFATPTLDALAAAVSAQAPVVAVPPNRIPAGCTAITPDLLPLVSLTATEIARIVDEIPGGAENIQDIYPLAPLQEGMLFHHLMGGEGDPHLEGVQLTFSSRAQLDVYLDAMRAVIARHDLLRTSVLWDGLPQPVQVVWRQVTLPVEELTLDQAGDVATQLYMRCHPRRARIDVRRAPLLRVYIADDPRHGVWRMVQWRHHLAGDQSPLDMRHEEMQASLLGRAGQLPPPVPFRNLVAQAHLGVTPADHDAFFRGLLGDVDEPTAPFGLLDVQGDGSEVTEARLPVDPRLARALRDRAHHLGVSVASVCHVAWAQALARLASRDDVVFGTVVFGRIHGDPGAEATIGTFINTLPVRIHVGEGVAESVRRMHILLGDLLRHEHAPLALAQRCSAVPAPVPLFSSLLNYRHSAAIVRGTADPTLPRAEERDQWHRDERTNYPLTVSVDDLGDGFRLTAQVKAPIAPERVCEYLHTALAALVHALETDPVRAVRTLEVLPRAERHALIDEWNATAAAYPSERCVHELFAAQASRTPDAIAVVSAEAALSYGELNRRANQLAHYLREVGVRPDTRVAICLERGLELVVALLGVLKAGGAYVPLDPAYPAERLRGMLADSAAAVLLTQQGLHGAWATTGSAAVAVIDVGDAAAPWRVQPTHDPGRHGLTPAHLAYVIYTSGTTGQPKGVMIPHAAVVNFLTAMQREPGLDAADVLLAVTTVSFDIAGLELYVPLVTGARVVLASREVAADADRLRQLLAVSGATVMQATPSTWRMLVEAGWTGSASLTALCGGEALPRALASQLRDVALWNMYGPTETTIWSMVDRVEPVAGPVPIGHPIANTRAYILDRYGRPTPVGVSGDVYIAGAGIARGYWQRPGLTAERFVADPYGAAGTRMYRTGDLGRWLADGRIEFLGRGDAQVKVRGYRIELGEIEARLGEAAGVHEAAVVLREVVDGDTRLLAYYTTRPDAGEVPTADGLRRHLSTTLPAYMMPAAYVRMDRLPLTPNGKVDRQALPDAETSTVRAQSTAPRTPEEEILSGLFADVLGVERVGLDDNFFELGGHSLLATRLVSRIRTTLHVELPIRTLFESPTVGALAPRLRDAERGRPILARRLGEAPTPLSYAQQRLWFLDQLEGSSTEYNMAAALRLKGSLDLAALQRTINAIVERHAILRTHFEHRDGEPIQVIAPELRIEVPVDDLCRLEPHEQHEQIRAAMRHERRRPFDLSQGPLLRMKLLKLSDHEHVLLRTLHHIVSDGWSEGVLDREFMTFYEAFVEGTATTLPPLSVQYADFAVWQREWLAGGTLDRGLEYWKQQLAGIPERIELPADRSRPAVQTFEGALHEVRVGSELLQQLKRVSQDSQATLYMTLLAAFGLLLSRHSGQDDIVVGTPIANRQDAQLEALIGFFVNTLAMRMAVTPAMSFRQLLADVRRMALEAYQHQDVPFEHLVETLAPRRSLSTTPVFQVVFALQNPPTLSRRMGDLDVEVVPREEVGVRFDLEVHAWERDGRMRFAWLYNRDLFEPWRIAQLARHYVRVLEAIVADAGQRVGAIELLTDEERRQLLETWSAPPRAVPAATVPELFEAAVARTPHAVAVVCGPEHVTYATLNARANQLAHLLLAQGVGPEDLVGLAFARSSEMIVAILGVLKAGAAYLPLDTSYPDERLAFMLSDAHPKCVLALTDTADRLRSGSPLVIIDEAGTRTLLARLPTTDPTEHDRRQRLTVLHPAYVMYTSGSTGVPKGVVVVHQSIVRLLFGVDYVELGPTEHVLHAAPVSFDASTLEIWGALLHGGRLVISPEGVPTGTELGRLLHETQVTTLWLTSSLYNTVVDEMPAALDGVRQLLVGGEALSVPHIAKGLAVLPSTTLINGYGPTECTTFACCYRIPRMELADVNTIALGRPIGNTWVYVLNEQLRLAPVGVTGDLYISGLGLARGYLNRPGLTAERFVADPYGAAGARMYRSGDLARWRADGQLEFVGRADHQVKVRGYRIELGEIEAVLKMDERVQASVAVVRGEADAKRIFAYVIREQGETERQDARTKRIEEWKKLYASTYEEQDRPADFNITGWNSAYTGAPISDDEMRIWVEETVARLRSLRARRVLEVGCGTGLLLSRLASESERYIGIDFSEVVLQQVDAYVRTRDDLKHVELKPGVAHDLSFLDDDSVDAVILNSVVQYFPDVEYLLEALREAVRVTAPGGHIFVGDVRSLPLLEAYHASVELAKARGDERAADVWRRVKERERAEEELVLDARLFEELGRQCDKVGRVDASLKAGRYDNELSRFRYDVVMSVGDKEAMEEPASWIEWDEAGRWAERVERAVNAERHTSVGVRGIRDGRVAGSVEGVRILRNREERAPAEQIRKACALKSGADPDDVMTLAARLGVGLRWRRFESDGVYEAIFNPRWRPAERENAAPAVRYDRYSNRPMRAVRDAELGRALRDLLQQELPEYMVPAAVIVLDEFPRTVTGKLDRQALPTPELSSPVNYQAPRTADEQILCGLFAEVLGLDDVGVDDDFFALGGHSLMAVRLIERMHRHGLQVNVRTLFMNPSVRQIAAATGDQGAAIEVPPNPIVDNTATLDPTDVEVEI